MSAVVEVLKSEPTMTVEGLMLAGTVLARMGRDRNGAPALVIDGGEERILALLALAYDRPIGAAVLGNVRRASSNYDKYDEEDWIRRGWSDGSSGVWK